MQNTKMIEIQRGIYYDEETGLPWSSRKSMGSKGTTYDNLLKRLIGKDSGGYLLVSIDGKLLKWHRVVYAHFHGPIPAGMEIDHVNNRRDDNRICNLQLLSSKDNSRHQKKYNTNTSGFPGVSWYKPSKKWCARIRINNKCHHLGLFDNINEAYAVYYHAKIQGHGPESVRCIPVPINYCSADSVLV